MLSQRSKQKDQSLREEHRKKDDTTKGMDRGFAKTRLQMIFLSDRTFMGFEVTILKGLLRVARELMRSQDVSWGDGQHYKYQIRIWIRGVQGARIALL